MGAVQRTAVLPDRPAVGTRAWVLDVWLPLAIVVVGLWLLLPVSPVAASVALMTVAILVVRVRRPAPRVRDQGAAGRGADSRTALRRPSRGIGGVGGDR